MSHKRQRTETVSADPIPFYGLPSWEWGEKVTGHVKYVAVDNKRGFLYLLITTPRVADGAPMVCQVVARSTASEIMATLLAQVTALSSFPPGVVPIICSYAEEEGQMRWQICVAPNRMRINHMEVHPVSGDLVCSMNGTNHLLVVHTNGTMNDVYPETRIITDCDQFTFDTSSGQCVLVDDHMTSTLLFQLEMKWSSYSARRIMLDLPRNIRAFIMDENYMYVVSGERMIYRVRRHPPEETKVIVMADYIYPLLAWCGPHHLLFARVYDEPDWSFSLFILDLITLDSHCVVTTIPRSDLPVGGGVIFSHDMDFCVVHGLARGPCILIRSGSELRTLPLLHSHPVKE